MDDDTLRRGRPTLHVVYGDGIAILAGDGLHAEAFTLLAREPASDGCSDLPARKLRVVRIVGEAAGAGGMVGGQAMDLQAGGQAPRHPITLDADSLRAMHALKTGALIRASAVSGAIMAGADERGGRRDRSRTRTKSDSPSRSSTTSSTSKAIRQSLGKTAGKDAAAAKPTYPALYGVGSIARARRRLPAARARRAGGRRRRRQPARRHRRLGRLAKELNFRRCDVANIRFRHCVRIREIRCRHVLRRASCYRITASDHGNRKARLDVVLVDRGLAPSRERAER